MSVIDRHGRRPGPPPGRLRLTDADVKAIRRELMIRLSAMGHSHGVIARVLTCGRSTVHRAVRDAERLAHSRTTPR